MIDATGAFYTLLYQLPALIVEIGGVVFAIMNWKRFPKAAMLALIGCGMLVLLNLSATGLQFLILLQIRANPMGVARYGQFLSWLGLARNFGYATGLGFLVAAVFYKRKPEKTRSLDDDDDDDDDDERTMKRKW